MSHKSDKYSSKETDNDLDTITTKLTQDLRKHIRELGTFHIFSPPWLAMAHTFGRIATIADMESKLADSKHNDATLWETEELALRYILEDGKLNLCLRNLISFKTEQIRAISQPTQVFVEFAPECEKFEKGLGTILRNAWNHVEALQTTDLYALVNYIAFVLDSALGNPGVIRKYCEKGDLHQRQEILVFFYLFDIMRHIEDIREDRIMPLIREKKVFMHAVHFLNLFYRDVSSQYVLKALSFMALLVDTDDFKTFRDQYICDARDASALNELKIQCIASVCKEFEQRKLVRPLVDAIDRAKRLHRI